ncbi:uncharacterized protein LOC113122256 [Mastacembelus armatus]|uniref:uncharacterized protein LOC113122256 n=1 Tax=Mastacembelus armatus TaxID=205130 RepID=UPI000E45878B|nr:uncharacterized protein LOC113122256 [Mastacembelus armatus]XP_026149242.1 uncharacterized protein LOC113122256 [Mastacembelus armatus]XP_026149243.1 uncharacterized protein LOC113122256 [Mastacembelus armatus]XP_026149245.1 uncharacterized protein LOC113122256 [Mastacembelus armatus]
MPSMIMERGQQNLQNVLEDGLSRDLMNAGRFCFSCEQIFADRQCLEEHTCSAASHICSCGTEFSEYKDMLEHSTTHEPGHQVLDHETIKKRRIEKHIEEEEKLNRLQTGEVVWKAPKPNNAPAFSLPAKPIQQVPVTSAQMPQPPMQPARIPQVPELIPSMSQASFLPKPVNSAVDVKNIFAGVGAPTVDLWTLYQPVVLLQTMRKFNKDKPYSCGKCGQCFMGKNPLVSHHSSHATDKVSGCIGCGLLLSSKKLVPRFHNCNSPNTATKFRLITAKPLSYKRLNETSTKLSQTLMTLGPQATSLLHMKSQNPYNTQTTHVNSTVPRKAVSISTINKSSHRFHGTPSLQLKSPNSSAFKSNINVSLPLKSQRPNSSASIESSRRFPVTTSVQLKTSTICASDESCKTAETPSAPNGFTCRVCHIPFETAQLLQRHKCIKAQEFMAQHVRGGRQQYKLKRVTPVANTIPALMNYERKVGVPASANIMKNPVMAVSLDKGQGAVSVNGKRGVDIDDDCYIVESGPDKPTEMIYQVTSSVPIKI